VDDTDLLKALSEALVRQRGYADFFNWSDERQKDLGLLAAFEEGAARLGIAISESRVEEEGEDPPDAWVSYESRDVAVEFTEFVDQIMIEQWKRTGVFQWRFWTCEEFTECQSIIQRKDHHGFAKDVRYWLVIHCDEPALDEKIIAPYLECLSAVPVQGIDRCFLLLSYEPEIQSYPVIELRVRHVV
jgi:hypothetical protein